MNQELINFHIQNGYFIKVQHNKASNGCFVEYPKSLLSSNVINDFISCYFIENNKIKKINEKDKEAGNSKCIDIPNYAARTIIAEDILLQTIKLKLNHNLIVCFDKNGNILKEINNLVDVLDKLEDSCDKSQELLLLNLLKDTLLGLDCSQQAQQLFLQDGYRIMKKIFDNGGMNNV